MIKLLGKNVLIERDETKEMVGGIIIPKNVQEKLLFGVVVGVGEAVKEVKIGDHILLKKYAPDEVKIEDKEYLICEEDDILAII